MFCHDNFIYQLLTKYNMTIDIKIKVVEKNMEILIIGVVAGAVAATMAICPGICPLQ